MHLTIVVSKEQTLVLFLILTPPPYCKVINGALILVRHFQIINMPSHSHLSAIHDLICNTWVIIIHNETISLQVSLELLVESQGAIEHSVECLSHMGI